MLLNSYFVLTDPLFSVRSGGVYESILVPQPAVSAPAEEIQALPRSLLLQLPAGDGELSCASLLPLDQAHVAVVGVPHPSAGTGKGTRLALSPPLRQITRCYSESCFI